MNFATHYPIIDNGRRRYGKRSGRQGAMSGFGPLKREVSVSPYNFPGLSALYDCSNLGSLSLNSSNQVQLWADISGNSAVNCFCSDGAASNTATSPTVSITGNFTASFDIAPTSWTPAASHTLFSKLNGNSGLEILLLITTGVIRVRVGDGAAITNFDSTVATGAAALSRHTIGITYVDNTSVAFTYDGAALGTTVVVNKVLANGAATATIGTSFAGRIYSAVITGKYNFNPSGASKLAISFVAPTTGETWTINTSGDTGARISGERDLVQMTASKRPVYLAYSGTKYGYLNATNGTYFSTPDAAKYNPTTSLSIQGYYTAADWTPSVVKTIAAKFWAQFSWKLSVQTSGFLRWEWSTVGGSLDKSVTQNANAAGFTDMAGGWLRVDLDLATGNVSFYKSTEAATTALASVTWTLMQAVAGAGATTVNDSTDHIEFGGDQKAGGTSQWAGNVYRGAVVVDGTVQGDFNPASYTSGTTFTATTGEVWTLNGGPTIVTRTCLYGDGSDDYMKAAAFSLSQPETVYFVGQQVSWTDLDLIYDGGTSFNGYLRQTTTTPQMTIGAGTALSIGGNLPLQTGGVVSSVYNSTSSAGRVNRLAATTGNAGSTASNGFTIFARSDGAAGAANATASEIALYSVADSTSAQNKKVSALMYQWRIP